MNWRRLARNGAFGIVAAIVAGCGGGGQAAGAGGFNLNVTWPSTRLIPELTQTLAVRVSNGAEIDEEQDISRPTTGSTTSTPFTGLPIGETLIVECEALGAPVGGSAPVLGIATAPVTLVPGSGNVVIIDLVSTIDQILITGTGVQNDAITLYPGQTITLGVTAFSAANRIVPIGPGNLRFASSGTAFTMTQSGNSVTLTAGATAGTGTLTATEAESGQTDTLTVTVG